MDRDLLRQSLSYHGQSLFSRLKCEQSENPDFKAIVSDLSKANFERRVGGDDALVEQFIARKADILFAPSWKSNTLVEEVLEEEEREPYAIMPPMELFMEVSYEERRNLFFMDMERGDVVIGRINSIRDFGFFLTLLCMGGGLERDIEDLELTALCPIRDVPSNGNHDDPLSYYQIGDLIRAGVKDIDRYHEKITISLQPSSVSPNLTSLKLGVLSKEELPLHYTRSGRVANDSTETYQRVMKSSLGYSNPSIVQYLLGKMGVSDTQPPSVMRGLQSKHFLEEDFATTIRKKQSASWALKCVRAGVDHFKSGRHVQAMNEYNKALEIDTNNVEALVARGALYANKGSVVKAIGDFELALETCPTHRNAKKYLCQTLVERGGQLEEEEKLVTAEGLYRRALTLDDSYHEAQEALRKIQLLIQRAVQLREEAAAKELQKAKSVETSAEKLRKILKEEKRMKRKQRRSSSSSSTSSSSSSSSSNHTSSTSGRRKSKKKKGKHRRSSRGAKSQRRVSSRDVIVIGDDGEKEKDEEEEDEWYPAPPNTSASFLNRRLSLERHFEGPEEPSDPHSKAGGSSRRSQSHYSPSSASTEAPDNSKGRMEDEERSDGSPQPGEGSHGRGGQGGRQDSRAGAGDREENGRDRDTSQSRRSTQEDQQEELKHNRYRKLSTSSAGSERSRKSDRHSISELPSQTQTQAQTSASRRSDRGRYGSGTSRRSSDSGRYEATERGDKGEESRATRRSDGGDYRFPSDGSRNSQGRRDAGGSPKKELPSNLLDIFSQIAQFQKEKCVKPRK